MHTVGWAYQSFSRDRVWDLLLFLHHTAPCFTGNVPPDKGKGRLYLNLHRNGGVDNVALRRLLPGLIALSSVQWHQNAFMRWYVGGVPVTRGKDRGKKVQADNLNALDTCAALLQQGENIVIAPEGTSHLRPGHLPFLKGAARVAAKALEEQDELEVIALSPVYLEPWTCRSPVEVYAASPLCCKSGSTVDEIHEAMCEKLESITLDAPDEKTLIARKQASWELSRVTGKPFSEILLETPAPTLDAMAEAHTQLHERLPRRPAYGVIPFLPLNYLFTLLLLIPLNLLAGLARIVVWPALALSRPIRAKVVDDNNVIALWRGQIAFPLVLLWSGLVAVVLGWLAGPFWGLALPGVEIAGLCLEPWRRLLTSHALALRYLGPKKLAAYRDELLRIYQSPNAEEK